MNNPLKQFGIPLLLGSLSFYMTTSSFNTWADSPNQAKSQLSQLEVRIKAIKNQLLNDQSEKEKLFKNLAQTEKKISDSIQRIEAIQKKQAGKQKNILRINQNISTLDKRLKQQQKQLAHHIRMRHKLGAVRPWEYLLSQSNAEDRARLFVWYHYLFQADQKLISDIQQTMSNLSQEKSSLHEENHALAKLKKEFVENQNHLISLKSEQTKLIQSVDKQIHSRNEQLNAYREDKLRLQKLINQLTAQQSRKEKLSVLKTIKKPDGQGKQIHLGAKTLKSPLEHATHHTKLINQGMVFLTKEGESVVSVLPGKVVFSDWLKGYGLLLIIDHGDGLMSLYAHNASLFAKVGTEVKQGEKIATVGHTGGIRENGLYFEVRKRGRAIPPREWIS